MRTSDHDGLHRLAGSPGASSMDAAWSLPKTADVLASFEGAPTFVELWGPGTLTRLIQFDRLADEQVHPGRFWFEEDFLQGVRNLARTDLAHQANGNPFTTPMNELIGNYMRHVFRNDLAVCKDWTDHFDGYLRLVLPPGKRLVALVGSVKKQPAYSPKDPQHEVVVARNVWLQGNATQYVVDFSFDQNVPLKTNIEGPFAF